MIEGQAKQRKHMFNKIFEGVATKRFGGTINPHHT